MKKFNALFFILALTTSLAFAQTSITPVDMSKQAISKSEVAASAANNLVRQGSAALRATNNNGPESTTVIDMDYDSLSNNQSAFFWNVHRRFTGGNMVSAVRMIFDTLHDVNTTTGYSQDNYYQRVDSFDIILRTQKFSDTTKFDTLIFNMADLSGATADTAWADTILLRGSLESSTGGFVSIRLYPNVTFCNGPFAIGVDFSGPIEDSLHLIAGFHEGMCTGALACGAEKPSVAGRGTSQYIVWSGGNPITSAFYDCNGSGSTDTCEYFVIQDWWMFPSLSLVDKPLQYTKSSTPDNGGGNGTAGISLTDDIDFTIIWQSIGGNNTGLAQDVLNQTNLNADDLLIGITINGFGCDGIVDTITVDGVGTAIDDLLNAGISSLNTFPNPSNGTFNLEMSLENMGDLTIKVLDLNGREIYRRQERAVSDINQSINLGDINAGIYYLEVQTELGTASTRIVIR